MSEKYIVLNDKGVMLISFITILISQIILINNNIDLITTCLTSIIIFSINLIILPNIKIKKGTSPQPSKVKN